jgi:hypothetical protein
MLATSTLAYEVYSAPVSTETTCTIVTIILTYKPVYIVACRLVVRQRLRKKRDKQPLLGSYQRANGLAE